MKRILCIILCSIMLLTLLPLSAGAAVSSFVLSMNTVKAYVGDTLTWRIHDVVGGVGPYMYSFDIYQNGLPYSIDSWHDSNIRTWKPTTAGSFKIRAMVNDLSDDTYFAFYGPTIVVSFQPLKIAGVTAVSGTSLKISWNEVPNADLYKVLSCTTKTGIYAYMKSTTDTTFTDSGLLPGTRYYYKVTAYRLIGSTYYVSAQSAILAGVPLDKATITAVTAPSVNRLKITWTKVPLATGYILYRSLSAGGVYAKICSTTALSFTNTGLNW